MKGEPINESQSLGSFAAACLAENGVETVFGIPGTHNIEIYRGLQRHGIRHVLTRHEQGATYAADGYARATGKVGVVIATSGPGVTNCITGIANAYADSIPLLVISPGAPRGQERGDLGFLHEAKDQRAGIDQFARHSVRVESQRALEVAVNRAFLEFRTGRSRPIHIEIPTDIMEEIAEGRPEPQWSAHLPSPASSSVVAVAEAICQADRPIILIGGGAAAAAAELVDLLECTGIPAVTTVQGKGIVSERNPLSFGAVSGGSAGFSPFGEADLILAFGTELKSVAPNSGTKIARFDIDASQLHKHRRSDLPVLGDVRQSVRMLLAELGDTTPRVAPSWVSSVGRAASEAQSAARETWAVLHEKVLDAAATPSGSSVVLTGDSSQISWLGTVKAATIEHPRSFLTTDGYATLGYGLPAAIGAKVARPDANVVSLLGDGALMFSVQELMTASELGLSLPVIVFDNGGYAEIEQNMLDAGVRPFAVRLTKPDYRNLALAMKCLFTGVQTPDQLWEAVRAAVESDRPTLIVIKQPDFESAAWRK